MQIIKQEILAGGCLRQMVPSQTIRHNIQVRYRPRSSGNLLVQFYFEMIRSINACMALPGFSWLLRTNQVVMLPTSFGSLCKEQLP